MFGLLIVVWVLCGAFSAYIAAEKGRDGVAWFFVGSLFGFLGLIAIAAVPVDEDGMSAKKSRAEELDRVAQEYRERREQQEQRIREKQAAQKAHEERLRTDPEYRAAQPFFERNRNVAWLSLTGIVLAISLTMIIQILDADQSRSIAPTNLTSSYVGGEL